MYSPLDFLGILSYFMQDKVNFIVATVMKS